MHRRDRHLCLALAVALASCGSNDAPRREGPRPASDTNKPPTPKAAPTPWLWVEARGATHLAYYYVDASAGPSAKGGVVDDPPTAVQLEAAVQSPTNTFRDPVKMGARALTREEVDALHLPARPEWLTIFEPSGTAAPKLPWVAHQGRDHTKPTASPEATAKPTEPSTEHLMLVQDGCERHGKGFIELGGGEERVVGTDKPSRSKLPPEHDIQPPIHVRVRNEAKTIVFEALDPQRLPLVDGKPAAKGELALGDTITIGNRVFAIAGAKQEQAIETPVKECPEFAMKDPAPPR